MFLIFFIQRRKIRKLLCEIYKVVREVLSAEETRKWSLKSSSLVLCWLVLCHGAHLVINYIFVVHIVDRRINRGIAAPDYLYVFGVKDRYAMPKWIFSTLSVVSHFLTLNTDLAGQLFYFVVIAMHTLTRVIVKINKTVCYQCLFASKVTVDAVT